MTSAAVAALRLLLSCQLAEVLPPRELPLELSQYLAKIPGGRQGLVVPDLEPPPGFERGSRGHRAFRGGVVDLGGGLGAAKGSAGHDRERLAPDRAEGALQLRAARVMLRQVVALSLAQVAIQAVGSLLDLGHRVRDPLAEVGVQRRLEGRVVETEDRLDRVVEPAADDEQTDHRVKADPRAQRAPHGSAGRPRPDRWRGSACWRHGICHTIAAGVTADCMHKECPE